MTRRIFQILTLVWVSTFITQAATYDPKVLPEGHEYFELRDGLANSRLKFEKSKTGRIAFLGGSITAMDGWRNEVIAYFTARFPETKFDFISAGIGSLGSPAHSFRLQRDVLSHGPVDLLFVEAAVNDTTNITDRDQMLRGMEGVVRHARIVNPFTDIVQMHFVMPIHMAEYNKGQIPASIAQHERVAAAYGNSSLNLGQEVTDRINNHEFTWDGDFKILHPAPFGQKLYANSITRMLDADYTKPLAATAKPHRLPPEPIDPRSYFSGRLGPVSMVKLGNGFVIDPAWKPGDGAGGRAGFMNVPALVGTGEGSEFQFEFEGSGVGLFITSGPDAGVIESSVDGRPFHAIDTFTAWSKSLHLPWVVILDDNLDSGHHVVRVRIATNSNPKRNVLRVIHLLLN